MSEGVSVFGERVRERELGGREGVVSLEKKVCEWGEME